MFLARASSAPGHPKLPGPQIRTTRPRQPGKSFVSAAYRDMPDTVVAGQRVHRQTVAHRTSSEAHHVVSAVTDAMNDPGSIERTLRQLRSLTWQHKWTYVAKPASLPVVIWPTQCVAIVSIILADLA